MNEKGKKKALYMPMRYFIFSFLTKAFFILDEKNSQLFF
jgi:hypothetical protein